MAFLLLFPFFPLSRFHTNFSLFLLTICFVYSILPVPSPDLSRLSRVSMYVAHLGLPVLKKTQFGLQSLLWGWFGLCLTRRLNTSSTAVAAEHLCSSTLNKSCMACCCQGPSKQLTKYLEAVVSPLAWHIWLSCVYYWKCSLAFRDHGFVLYAAFHLVKKWLLHSKNFLFFPITSKLFTKKAIGQFLRVSQLRSVFSEASISMWM